jgi:hypothetical protein
MLLGRALTMGASSAAFLGIPHLKSGLKSPFVPKEYALLHRRVQL